MLAGGLMLPEADGFGPCFTRTTGKVRRFELGFEPKSLVGDVKTIRDLQAGSEADKAGLKAGDVVTKGQPVIVLEAMKMEHALTAPFDGVAVEVNAAVGDQVAADAVLAIVKAEA